ncbi:MAG: beta-eliminating lyase-related protein, partial [Verrucomicrobiae bacterium]|nr:beta-eliminating lyase-related protein [Verrucomicrobiae bacterium]
VYKRQVYHGPRGLLNIARRVHSLTNRLVSLLCPDRRFQIVNKTWFDTITVRVDDANAVHQRAENNRINLRRVDSQHVGISLDETVREAELEVLLGVLGVPRQLQPTPNAAQQDQVTGIPSGFVRTSPYLTAKVFNQYHSETEMLRYIRRLESRDLSLCHSMIPLGSCTMKLSPTTAMLPLSWCEFSAIHPFAPRAQVRGYETIFTDLKEWISEITGLPAVSLQPNAGSQGEYAGLLVIRKYLTSIGQGHRKICLIPSSAHGTNPASAAMAGLRPVQVQCDSKGNIDLEDLKGKARLHAADLAALMVTYPSTHGVFEETIREVCEIVHSHGGQVYMDGA